MADPPVEALLADASVERGKSASAQCIACHTFEKGGPNRVGPNLFGVVGRKKDAAPGFNYSAAMKKQSGSWTFQDLYEFIKNPKGMVPGTNMTFGGIPRAATPRTARRGCRAWRYGRCAGRGSRNRRWPPGGADDTTRDRR